MLVAKKDLFNLTGTIKAAGMVLFACCEDYFIEINKEKFLF